MAGTRILCLGILMATCLAVFFYRGDMLISMSRDSLHVQSRRHLSMRALTRDHSSRMQAVRQHHADTLPNIRHHAGNLQLYSRAILYKGFLACFVTLEQIERCLLQAEVRLNVMWNAYPCWSRSEQSTKCTRLSQHLHAACHVIP